MNKARKTKAWKVNGVLILATSIDNAIETYRRIYPKAIPGEIMSGKEVTSAVIDNYSEAYFYDDLI